MSTQNIRVPHIETNEDNRPLQHIGYNATPCAVCGRPNLHARNRAVMECIGDHKKEKDASPG